MKNDFDRLTSRLDMAQEGISEYDEMSMEISQTELGNKIKIKINK